MNLLKFKNLDINPSRLNETATIQMVKAKGITTSLAESTEENSYLLPRIEAIHAGRTRNNTHYLAEKLKGDPSIGSGVYSWLEPYAKPVIYNHDTYTEATGRIMSAAYTDFTQAGRPGIIVIPKITEPGAVKALKDGRLLTVSIGAESDAAICSICGTDIVNEGYCGHMKGEEYEGRVCEWIAGNIWFDELSWVNVPADSDAMVVDTQSSVFLDMPRESAPNARPLTESASFDKTTELAERFGVSKHIPLVVVESKELTNPAEKIKQEDNREMENETKEASKAVVESEVTTVEDEITKDDILETETVEETEEPTTEEPVVENPSSAEETPVVEDADKSVEGIVAGELGNEILPEQITTDSLLATDESLALKEQNNALVEELKALYIEKIMTETNVPEDRKESLKERLSKRTIESLKDRLEDLREEASFVEKTIPTEKEAARKVTKVASPVPVKESVETKEKETTSESKINLFSTLLRGK